MPTDVQKYVEQHRGRHSRPYSTFNDLPIMDDLSQILNDAVTLHRQGKLSEADSAYRKILRLDSQHVDALHLSGVVALQQENYELAYAQIQQAVELDPEYAGACYNLGLVYEAKQELQQAEEYLQRAVFLEPENSQFQAALGNVCQEMDRHEDAIACFEVALKFEPQNAELHNNRGHSLRAIDRHEEAKESFGQAVSLDSSNVAALNNLGAILHREGNLQQAKRNFEQAIAIDSSSLITQINLGNISCDIGDYTKGIGHYGEAIRLDPNSAAAHFNRALAWIKNGEFTLGWDEYEWRWKKKVQPREFPLPVWVGTPVKNLLVYGEQGVGDEVMFASCLSDVIPLVEQCFLECDPRLVDLFSRSFPLVNVIARPIDRLLRENGPLPAMNAQIALGSLPGLFRRELESFHKRAYLQPDAVKVDTFRRHLKTFDSRPKIGISWKGGGEIDTKWLRSTALEDWQSLLANNGYCFISLQQGSVEEEIAEFQKNNGIDLLEWKRFSTSECLDELLAFLAAVDLVITVDNSAAHFAGAIGQNVWTLLPYSCDFRWMHWGDESIWYPNVKLFRQPTPRDWQSVFDNLRDEL